MSDVNTVTIARNLLEALIDQHITAHGHTNAIARAAQLSLDRPASAQVPAEIRQFRHPQWADRSRWCDIENPSDEGSLAEAGMVFRTIYAAQSRCHLCNYQHGHKIGCVNNPVDIALRSAAPAKEGE